MGLDIFAIGVDSMRHELGKTDFINMCVVDERLLDIPHVRATAGQDDAAQQFVVVVGRYLVPYVLDDLLQTTFHNLNELTALHLAFRINGVHQVVVDVIIVSKG